MDNKAWNGHWTKNYIIKTWTLRYNCILNITDLWLVYHKYFVHNPNKITNDSSNPYTIISNNNTLKTFILHLFYLSSQFCIDWINFCFIRLLAKILLFWYLSDLCKATVTNGNSISTDATKNTIRTTLVSTIFRQFDTCFGLFYITG